MSDSEKLLTAEEQVACQKIAASGEGLAGQRAAALLAIDQGATRAQASEQAGLTVNQVGYLLGVFRQKRLSLFPDTEPIEEKEEKASEPKEAKKAKAKKPKKDKKDKDKMKAKKKDKEPKKDKKSKSKKGKDAKKKSKKK
ncbi:MAG: helix-turn-helix domain-containing protein [Anaerolineae bacterium]